MWVGDYSFQYQPPPMKKKEDCDDETNCEHLSFSYDDDDGEEKGRESSRTMCIVRGREIRERERMKRKSMKRV